MKYEVKEVTNTAEWENFLISHEPNTFLQNWNWSKFNESLGRAVYRLGIYEKENLAGIALLIKYETRLGNYLYCPRGPIFDWSEVEIFDSLLQQTHKLASETNSIFVKFDPLLEETSENREIFKTRGFKPAVTYVQVEDAWLLNLEKSEEELLADMRKTTRYLIRHEPKNGVTVEISDKIEDIKKFTSLLYETASRKSFVNHSKDYYIKQFDVLSKDNQMRIFKSIKKGKILSMAVVAFYGNMAYYLHGASSPESKSAGYPLQWEIIKESKRRGIKTYNFWGVVKEKNFHPGHPWYGFSLFKRGFGGYKYSYIRAQDLPMSNKYWVYRYTEKSRRLLNRLKNGYWEN